MARRTIASANMAFVNHGVRLRAVRSGSSGCSSQPVATPGRNCLGCARLGREQNGWAGVHPEDLSAKRWDTGQHKASERAPTSGGGDGRSAPLGARPGGYVGLRVHGLRAWMVTPWTTRLTVPEGKGLSGVLPKAREKCRPSS